MRSVSPTYLELAVALSLLLHGILLSLHFKVPRSIALAPTPDNLDIVLVNARHERAPLKADVLAQANLDGGGRAQAGHAKSPLPDSRSDRSGESVRTLEKRVASLQQQQTMLLTRLKQQAGGAAMLPHQVESAPMADTRNVPQTAQKMSHMLAEISDTIEEQNRRPHKTYGAPAALGVSYALYYKQFQKRIEDIGTLNFPRQNGEKFYGTLILTIPIFRDGSIYDKEGGIRIDRSSGNPTLDKAALRIVTMAAPFAPFPDAMGSNEHSTIWVIVTRFDFTREGDIKLIRKES